MKYFCFFCFTCKCNRAAYEEKVQIATAHLSATLRNLKSLGVNNPYDILYIYTLSVLLSATVHYMKFLYVNKSYVILKEINQPTQNILN